MSIRKGSLFWVLAFLGVVTGALILVGRAQADSIGFSLAGAANPGTAADISVTVLDDATLQPVTGASVTLADSLATARGAQSLRTGAQGEAGFHVQALAPRAITVSKDGYSTLSIVGVQATQVTVYLKARPVSTTMPIASGTMSGFPSDLGGDTIHAGVVLRSLSALDLLHFDPQEFISPLKDQIDVMGPHDIPSNLVVPEQDIFVLFAPVTLDKPTYRLPVIAGRETRLTGVQGEIAVDDLVSLLQGGGHLSMDLLNKLRFTRAGLSDSVTPTADFAMDVPSQIDLSPAHTVTPSQPPFDGDVIIAAAADMSGDRQILMPTDVKLAAKSYSGQYRPVRLSNVAAGIGHERDVVTVAMTDKGKRMSGIVTGSAGATVRPGEFLQADALADVASAPESVQIAPPANGVGALVFETAARDGSSVAAWYIYSLPAAGAVSVPTQAVASAGLASYSVMQLDFGTGFDEKAVDGQAIMSKLQRFTRSTAKIGQTQR